MRRFKDSKLIDKKYHTNLHFARICFTCGYTYGTHCGLLCPSDSYIQSLARAFPTYGYARFIFKPTNIKIL